MKPAPVEDYHIKIRPFIKNDLIRVSQISSESFRTKMGKITGVPEDKIADFLIRCGYVTSTPHPGYFVAEVDDRVSGYIELRLYNTPLPKADIRLFSTAGTYGFYRTLRTLISAAIFHQKLKPGECYLEQLAVSPDTRGKGLGKRLIQKGKNYAASTGCNNYTLTVASENKGAVKLYEKCGFTTKYREDSIICQGITGIRHWNYMTSSIGQEIR